LRQAAADAHGSATRLLLALHLSSNPEQELAALADAVHEEQPPVAAWLLFTRGESVTTAAAAALARQALAPVAPGVLVGGGTDAYFTELNRNHPPLDALDFIGYSLNPQVHAFDNTSLVETLAAQATTLESARQFCGDRPLWITPVTLRPRFNPNATGPTTVDASRLPDTVDPRQ